MFNRISKKQSKYKVYQYDKDGNIIKIWDSKEQVYKAGFTSIKSALRQGFNRYFNGYFWFKEDEPFDKNRYMLQLNKLVFIIETLISYCLQELLENVLNFWV